MPFEATYGEYADHIKANLDHESAEINHFPTDAVIGQEYFELYMQEAIRVAEERNVMLYCGEYGVIELADPADALKWYDLITACFNKYGIGRAAWTYKEMDFGLNVPEMAPVRKKL